MISTFVATTQCTPNCTECRFCRAFVVIFTYDIHLSVPDSGIMAFNVKIDAAKGIHVLQAKKLPLHIS